MNKLISLILFSMALTNGIYGQISFENSSSILANQNIHSGFVFAVGDLNGDRLDDILRYDGAVQALIDFQNSDGTFTPFNVGSLTNSDVWSAVIADVDEDGINDFITGAYYEPIVIVKPRTDGLVIEDLGGPDIFMQGASFADINNDGALDYFACHDDAVSNPYQNDGIGNLFHAPDLINTATTDPSFNSGNYSCIWVDYDNDGDSDMYLSKCRLGVTDSLDARRINRMFQNDGKGNYIDVAEEIGLRPLGQSWATEFGDIDNDGDMDAIIINHDINTMLYENDGTGNFTDISIEAGIDLPPTEFVTGLQTYMYDFDNDTYLDILVTSYNTFPYLYRNNGNKTFTRLNNEIVFGTDINTDNNNNIQSGAIGDLNNDGFLDFIAGFANGINIPNSMMEDRLFLNGGSGNGNNYLKIDLKGIESNLNGIGARIEVNGSWGTLIRDVKAGQGYGIMNSIQSHFGIGSATEEICQGDSIEIFGEERDAPGVYSETVTSNGVDTIYQTTLIVHPTYLNVLPPLTGCNGTTIIVNDQMISESGQYSFEYESEFGCDSIFTVDIEILDPISITESINDDWGSTTSGGAGAGSITLDMTAVAEPYTIEWSTGAVDTTAIYNLLPNNYTVTITDGNGCFETFTYTVDLNTSVTELQDQGIEIYPIPTNNALYLKDKNDIASKLELFSIVGKRVITQSIVSQITEINMSTLTSGMYILKMYDNNNQIIGTTKVVKD